MRIFLAIYFFLIVTAVSILGFRGQTTTKTPIEVFPDMDRQARYKLQAENAFFADGRNDRPVPAGTVARGNYHNQLEVFSAEFEDTHLGDSAYTYGKNPDGSFVDSIPVEITNQFMAQGQEKYEIFCASVTVPPVTVTVSPSRAECSPPITTTTACVVRATVTSSMSFPTVRAHVSSRTASPRKNVGQLCSTFGHCSSRKMHRLLSCPPKNAQS